MVVLNMPAELEEVLPAASRAPYALGVLGLVVVLMVSGVVPNVQAALIGCLLMGLLGCVDFNSAYGSISWKTLILIVGMLPFSLALQRTGGVDLAADAVVRLVGSASPRLVLATLIRHHGCARFVHLQHRNSRADGAGGTGHCEGPRVVALSVRHDHRSGGFLRVHDADLLAGEHAGGRSRAVQLRRLRAGRRAVHRLCWSSPCCSYRFSCASSNAALRPHSTASNS